jgi:NADPH2:quinone reductase
LGHYTADRAEILERTNALFEWLTSGQLKVRIDKTFPLADAGEAHHYLENRQSKGKLLLIP